MNEQKLSHGVSLGVNNISINKILEWQNSRDINCKAFLWYIIDYIKVIDFEKNWFKVNIVSNKQLIFFIIRLLNIILIYVKIIMRLIFIVNFGKTIKKVQKEISKSF